MIARRVILGWVVGSTVACAANTAPAQPLDSGPCQQWRLVVSNPSPEQVGIYVSGEGPERLMGFVGPSSSRSWIIASEPTRVEARGGVRDEVNQVEIGYFCISRRSPAQRGL